ncbi:acyl-CoA N-acyltransferase [Periconia macrospinosa]|uniref:Acyl-CoA N-acyltransferase n=1 Tax=Periconia macrospinosa TaxID=97972 RepID=A0A2V1DPP0_9PLEO|nr:acyl-CoA N-acyltransferase [Periconia macrospinosa]
MSDNSEYVIVPGTPSSEWYHDLRKLAGLTPPPPDAMSESVPRSLANSWHMLVAYERKHMVDGQPAPGQNPAGMGRLVGDGAMFLIMCDIAVHPDHQRKGIGKRISQMLVDYVDAHAPHAYVSLVADPMGQALYPKFGFEDVKPAVGMFRCVYSQKDKEGRKAILERQLAAARGEI